jgi:O-antigen/teichoic acid export membrane protein
LKPLKHLLSDTLVYGISSVIARFINYLLVPFHTGLFNPEAYGIVGLVYAAIGLLQVLFTFGMESSYLRYGKDREQAASIFSTIQRALLAVGLLISLVLLLFQDPLSELLSLPANATGGDRIYILMMGILLVDALAIVPFAELRLTKRAYPFAWLKLGHVAINVSLNGYLILVLDWGIEAIFMANLIASLAALLGVFGLTGSLWWGAWSSDTLRKMVQFGWPFIPAGLAHVINETLDRFFLKNLSGEQIYAIYGTEWSADHIVGVYNACYKLAVFMLLLVQMYRMAWQPFFMRYSDDPDAPNLFGLAFKYFNIAAALVFLTVGLFVESIVAIPIPLLNTTLIDEAYWSGLSIVPWLLLAYWFQGWYINFSVGVFIQEKTKRLAQITGIGAIITIIVNVALIPVLGMKGAAIATVLSYGTMAVILYQVAQKAMQIPFGLIRAFGTMIVASSAVWGAQSLQMWIDLPKGLAGFLILVLTMLVIIPLQVVGVGAKSR